MVTFTEKAKKKVLDFMKANSKEGQYLRITVPNWGTHGFNYQFFLDEEKNKKDDDTVIEGDEFITVVDAQSAKNLKGATVDWAEHVTGSGFKVDNPNKPQTNLDSPVAQRVQELLDNEINPGVASHGGFIELLGVEGSKALLRMSGGCQGCGMASATLREGVEARIKQMVPEITEVVDTTDHTAGQNPYYSS